MADLATRTAHDVRAPRTVVFTGVLVDRRRSLVLWALALAAVTAVYVSFYPAIGGGDEMAAMMDAMPEDLVVALGYDRIGTPGGYLTSTVYGLLGPALLLVFGIGGGARTLAGGEEDGTLELEFAGPVGRRQVVLERTLALWVSLAVLVAVVVAVTVALVTTIDFGDVGVGDVLVAGLGLWLLSAAFASISLAAGAVTGRRAVALGTAAGLAVVSYVGDALSGLADGAAWLARVSPFGWYLDPDPLVEGPDALGYLLLAGSALAALGIALWAIERRDLGT